MKYVKRVTQLLVVITILMFVLTCLMYKGNIDLNYNGVNEVDNIQKSYMAILYPVLSIIFYFIFSKLTPKDIKSLEILRNYLRIGVVIVLTKEKESLVLKRVQELFLMVNLFFQILVMIGMLQVLVQTNFEFYNFVYIVLFGLIVVFVVCIYRIYGAVNYNR